MTTFLSLLIVVLDIIALVKLLTGNTSATHKLIWALLIIFLPLIGMLLYFVIGQKSNV